MPTLRVTGGSLGAKGINDSIAASLDKLNAAGIQVLHIVGDRANLEDISKAGYSRMAYCKAMDVAISASDFAVSRAGASTVSEFAATGLPALYIPYPVGNGEQRLNAASIVEAGGGLLIDDSEFNSDYVSSTLIPLISHKKGLIQMSNAAKSQAIIDARERLAECVLESRDTNLALLSIVASRRIR